VKPQAGTTKRCLRGYQVLSVHFSQDVSSSITTNHHLVYFVQNLVQLIRKHSGMTTLPVRLIVPAISDQVGQLEEVISVRRVTPRLTDIYRQSSASLNRSLSRLTNEILAWCSTNSVTEMILSLKSGTRPSLCSQHSLLRTKGRSVS
jgi:hypothetical protein